MRLRFLRQAPGSGRFRRTAPLCGNHPLQRHKPADIVSEVLQASLGFRPHDTDRPYNPTTRRGLLSTEHVLPFAFLAFVGSVFLFLHSTGRKPLDLMRGLWSGMESRSAAA